MGWKWVLYWPAIGCAFGFIILFFLMEETNYDRKTVGVVEIHASSASSTTEPASEAEKGARLREAPASTLEAGTVYQKKTFLQKLSLMDKPRPNNLLTMVWRPFTFISLPVVVYSGFAYGCTVVWALLNSGTASLILSSPPYNFKPSIVGLFSVASLIGCLVGYVVLTHLFSAVPVENWHYFSLQLIIQWLLWWLDHAQIRSQKQRYFRNGKQTLALPFPGNRVSIWLHPLGSWSSSWYSLYMLPLIIPTEASFRNQY